MLGVSSTSSLILSCAERVKACRWIATRGGEEGREDGVVNAAAAASAAFTLPLPSPFSMEGGREGGRAVGRSKAFLMSSRRLETSGPSYKDLTTR